MFVPAFFGLLLAAFVTGQNVHITPTHAVRRVGSEVTVLCKVDPRPYGPSGIDSCRISINGAPYRLRPEDSQAGDVVYFGQGLQLGECGARIRNIKEEWNGLIVCNLPPASGNRELEGKMTLTVARAPQPPVLLTPDQVVFREGDRFDAQCIVANGRPPASIKWYLGDELLLVGLHDVNITKGTDSKHPDAQTISQNLTRTVRADDSGRMLTCSADHEALETPTNASRPLNVQYPPKHVDGESSQITIFGLKLGAEGRLNVTVRANPPPNAEWTVGAERLRPMQKNQDGTITALEPVALGGGYYNVTLVLMSVNKEDVDRAYHLRVFNDLGGDELSVRISTMDERAGVELETGAIVGIVVAVLALLIAAFLIVFAKATDRWCFAGDRTLDHTKGSGESTPAGTVLLTGLGGARTSDTESAVGGRAGGASAGGRLAALGARMRAALPKGRDKVQASERTDEDKPAEEKKGVVYAELTLGEAPAGDKPPPPSTEYAEIVYTEQGQKEAKE